MVGSTECPLCGETFAQSTIESHASTCGIENKSQKKRGFSSLMIGSSCENPNKKSKTAELVDKRLLGKNNQLKSTSTSVKSDASIPCGAEASASQSTGGTPLAEIMRPQDWDSYIGQDSVVGESTQLRKLLETNNIPSVIMWGPPGCGKTSLANVIANKVKGKSRFIKMSACTCGVSEVRDIVKQAKNEQAMFKRRTILFMDEVHRFNKSQQDSFLPHIESGVITLIGATTENPSFCLNAALLSRCRVVVLDKLGPESIIKILRKALLKNDVQVDDSDQDQGISSEAVTYLANIVDGDARSAINTLQLVIQARIGSEKITLDQIKEAAKRCHVLYDRTGDQHYFMASALQKSIRGSDDNAALYWLGRMLKGGEDPSFIARRLVRCASEDIGLGDPSALPLAVSAFQGCQLIGKPECDVLLAQATVHLARAKKSHEVYRALKSVYQTIDQGLVPAVPLHLRNPTSKLTKQIGWGEGYSANLNHVQSVEYLPDELKGTNFFNT